MTNDNNSEIPSSPKTTNNIILWDLGNANKKILCISEISNDKVFELQVLSSNYVSVSSLSVGYFYKNF